MSQPSNVVSIHPYFKVQPGKLEQFKAGFAAFIARTTGEKGVLYYEFSVCGDIVHCREAYAGAEGLLAHMGNVGDLIGEALKISSIERLEVHGSAVELAKLRGPLAHLNPAWFVVEAGFRR